MKIKGQEYPVNILKVILHETSFDKLDWIKETLKLKNNTETVTTIINSIFDQLKQMVDYYEGQALPESEDKDNK
jgi:hypothetical protein